MPLALLGFCCLIAQQDGAASVELDPSLAAAGPAAAGDDNPVATAIPATAATVATNVVTVRTPVILRRAPPRRATEFHMTRCTPFPRCPPHELCGGIPH